MKFLTTLTTILYALALGASAIPLEHESRAVAASGFGASGAGESNPRKRPAEGEARTEATNIATPARQSKKIKSDIEPDKYYAFTMTWPENPDEKNEKMKELTNELKFSHIGLMVGKATKTPSEGTVRRPAKGSHMKYDFEGTIFDLVAGKDGVVKEGDTNSMGSEAWKPSSKEPDPKSPTTVFVQETTQDKNALTKKGKEYIAAHPAYEFTKGGANCGEFVDYLKKSL